MVKLKVVFKYQQTFNQTKKPEYSNIINKISIKIDVIEIIIIRGY